MKPADLVLCCVTAWCLFIPFPALDLQTFYSEHCETESIELSESIIIVFMVYWVQ